MPAASTVPRLADGAERLPAFRPQPRRRRPRVARSSCAYGAAPPSPWTSRLEGHSRTWPPRRWLLTGCGYPIYGPAPLR